MVLGTDCSYGKTGPIAVHASAASLLRRFADERTSFYWNPAATKKTETDKRTEARTRKVIKRQVDLARKKRHNAELKALGLNRKGP